MTNLRRKLGRWLVRVGQRLAPPTSVKVHLTADTREFQRAMQKAIRTLPPGAR